MLPSNMGTETLWILLLEKKADIEAKGGFLEQTPLHCVPPRRGTETLRILLLEEKADTEATDQYGKELLFIGPPILNRTDQDSCDASVKKGRRPRCPRLRWKRRPFLSSFARSLGPEALGKLLAEMVHLWSRAVLVAIIKLDNQDFDSELTEELASKCIGWNGQVQSWNVARCASVPERLRTVLAERLRTVLAPARHGQGWLAGWIGCLNFLRRTSFVSQEVPVTLKHLPGVWGSDAVNEDFLKTLADCPHRWHFRNGCCAGDGLSCVAAVSGLHIAGDLLMHVWPWFAFVGHRMAFGTDLHSPLHPLYVVAALHLKKSLDESNQALPHLVQCLKCSANLGSYMTFDNAADALYLVGGWLAIARQLSIGSDELEKPWMAIFAAAAWLRLLYSLRAETWMGPKAPSHTFQLSRTPLPSFY